MRSSPVLMLALSVALASAMTLAWGHRADPAATGDQPPQTINLGSIEIKGQENVVKVLRSIKAALKTPYSDSPEHADDLVAGLFAAADDCCGSNRGGDDQCRIFAGTGGSDRFD